MIEKLEKAEARFVKLEESLADPEIYKDQESYAALMKERKALTPVIEKYRAYKAAVAARDGAAELRDDAAQDSELLDDADRALERTAIRRPELLAALPPEALDPADRAVLAALAGEG